MTIATITASWTGKAAYELIRTTGRTGKEANRMARRLAGVLLDHGVDLARVDPRAYAQNFSRQDSSCATEAVSRATAVTDWSNRQAEYCNQF